MFTNKILSPTPVHSGNGYVAVPGEHGECVTVDPEAYEKRCALLERNEQAARRRIHENEYWRQRTLARQFQSQPSAQIALDREVSALTPDPLETMDAKHRTGEMLNLFMDEYNQLQPSQPFFDWVSSMTPATQMRMVTKVMESRGFEGRVKRAWVRTFNRGIRYMNAGERSSYRIEFTNGLLYQNGALFDTRTMKTRYSGIGAAVFVQSMNGTFYSSSHLWGRWNHAMPAPDAPCKSAGEWKVTKGRIEWISDKSGFYEPTVDQLAHALNDLETKNALSQTVDREAYSAKD